MSIWLRKNTLKVAAAALSIMLFASTALTHAGEVLRDSQQVQVQKATANLKDGFLGREWGMRPEEFAGARHLADIEPEWQVYTADLDVSPLLGPVSAYSCPRLVFSASSGLVKAQLTFDPKDYDAVYHHLISLLGEPIPIMYEVMAVSTDALERSEWRVGQETMLVLAARFSGASLEISRRNTAAPAGKNFESMLNAAMMKQGREYEQKNRISAASSIYQELLGGTGVDPVSNMEARERLAELSRFGEVAVYLAEERGMTFYGLVNMYGANNGSRWVRMNLGPAAQRELQPGDAGLQDGAGALSAVLFRVKAVPAAGKYIVAEQLWLDDSGKIIGGRPPWASQEYGWPAGFIKQACERFLEGWFFHRSGNGPENNRLKEETK